MSLVELWHIDLQSNHNDDIYIYVCMYVCLYKSFVVVYRTYLGVLTKYTSSRHVKFQFSNFFLSPPHHSLLAMEKKKYPTAYTN